MRITSLQNGHIKRIVKLHKRRSRDREGQMLIEGYRAIHSALENRWTLSVLYICPALYFGKDACSLIEKVAQTGTCVIEVAEAAFRKMAFRQRPEGLLAIAPQNRQCLMEQCPKPNGFYIIAESIEKPGNLGTILRSADCTNADAVIVCNPYTDPFHPDVVRGSVGAFFNVSIWESSSQQAIEWCRKYGIRTLATTPHTDTLYTEIDMRQPVALVVGTEQYGLSQTWLQKADEQIKLPMFGQVDSLNVSMAATLLLYEVIRQREEN